MLSHEYVLPFTQSFTKKQVIFTLHFRHFTTGIMFVQTLIVSFISCKKRKKLVKTTTKYVLSGVAAVVVALAIAPFVMAESGFTHYYHDGVKSHDGH